MPLEILPDRYYMIRRTHDPEDLDKGMNIDVELFSFEQEKPSEALRQLFQRFNELRSFSLKDAAGRDLPSQAQSNMQPGFFIVEFMEVITVDSDQPQMHIDRIFYDKNETSLHAWLRKYYPNSQHSHLTLVPVPIENILAYTQSISIPSDPEESSVPAASPFPETINTNENYLSQDVHRSLNDINEKLQQEADQRGQRMIYHASSRKRHNTDYQNFWALVVKPKFNELLKLKKQEKKLEEKIAENTPTNLFKKLDECRHAIEALDIEYTHAVEELFKLHPEPFNPFPNFDAGQIVHDWPMLNPILDDIFDAKDFLSSFSKTELALFSKDDQQLIIDFYTLTRRVFEGYPKEHSQVTPENIPEAQPNKASSSSSAPSSSSVPEKKPTAAPSSSSSSSPPSSSFPSFFGSRPNRTPLAISKPKRKPETSNPEQPKKVKLKKDGTPDKRCKR